MSVIGRLGAYIHSKWRLLIHLRCYPIMCIWNYCVMFRLSAYNCVSKGSYYRLFKKCIKVVYFQDFLLLHVFFYICAHLNQRLRVLLQLIVIIMVILGLGFSVNKLWLLLLWWFPQVDYWHVGLSPFSGQHIHTSNDDDYFSL